MQNWRQKSKTKLLVVPEKHFAMNYIEILSNVPKFSDARRKTIDIFYINQSYLCSRSDDRVVVRQSED